MARMGVMSKIEAHFISSGVIEAKVARTWALVIASVVVFSGISIAADDKRLDQAKALVLTPSSEIVAPVAITRTDGDVTGAASILREDGKSCRLSFEKSGSKPVVVLDFGKQSVGGYAVFTVKAKTGQPVVRLAYANHPDGLSETGDFSLETSARYLGATFDLPVLPANVNRHEFYTIPRTGRFIAPLIQGQARYLRLQLDSPGTSVEIDSVVMVNSKVHDLSPHDGAFLCSDDRLNRLWYISTWTLQIASFPNHDAWKTVDGWLLPRKLEQADDIGLSKAGAAWSDVVIDTTFELRTNPHHVSAAGVAFRAKDVRNAYLAEISLDGIFRLICRKNDKDAILSEKRLAAPLTDGVQYHLKIEARGQVLKTLLDGAVIDTFHDKTFATGRVGFYTPRNKWPLFDQIQVTDGAGKLLLLDDFSGDLAQWEFARTLSYLADGAKRDRLIWSGDLYFAQRSAYYAFANPTYLRDSLKMLAFNQTPEGYVNASPYPENAKPPKSGDYGPFPSDEFAAWLVPVAWDHLLYTDDTATLREIYPAIKKLLGYLSSHIGSNGLFVQRHETSKHACNLELGDLRTRAYMNILLWRTFTDAALIADHLGLTSDGDEARKKSLAMKQALFDHLWDETNGHFKDALETPSFGSEANALALSMGLVTPEQALRIAPHFKKIAHGKFQSLASRGRFEYGFAQSGLQAILDHNWVKLIDAEWKGATTVTECMDMITNGWGDESHPDSAIADHFSAFLLGVKPTSAGFKKFTVKPQPTREVRWAKGIVPTPHGPISTSWEIANNTLKLSLTIPNGTSADILLPKGGKVTVNGKEGVLTELGSGTYQIEVSDMPADAWTDPTDRQAEVEKELKPLVKASSTHEDGGWGLAQLFSLTRDAASKGYSSQPSSSDKTNEWLEFDLGVETTLAGIVLYSSDGKTTDGKPGANFPRDFKVQIAKQAGEFTTVANYTDCPTPDDQGMTVKLNTVIGYPKARYVRVSVTRLGAPSADEPSVHRLQLSRVRILRP